MPVRNKSLDALRGLAILAMVFSGSIAFGILPAWMYHAQTPPPSHSFQPSLAGISWVDLVFPFFLFSMGAAIPLALKRKTREGTGTAAIAIIALRRFALLVFFALFTMHARTISSDRLSFSFYQPLLQLLAFLLLFAQLYQWSKKRSVFIAAIAFAGAVLMMVCLRFKGNTPFLFQHSDIIIIVLANMALFGTLLWWLTRQHPWYRLAVLPFVMAVFLAKDSGSWNESLFNWSPLPWAYRFYYLKYLFIIVPGTVAGDWLVQYAGTAVNTDNRQRHWLNITAITCSLVLVGNVVLLFSRHTGWNMLITALSLAILLVYTRRTGVAEACPLLVRFLKAGTVLLLLGLFWEAFEGGIKKDPSTWSYYFVTAGLAFFMIIILTAFQHSPIGEKLVHYLSENGRNPMVAYVAGNLLLLPLLHLTGGITAYKWMLQKPLTGVLAGVLFTGFVSLITVAFVRKGWLWKT